MRIRNENENDNENVWQAKLPLPPKQRKRCVLNSGLPSADKLISIQVAMRSVRSRPRLRRSCSLPTGGIGEGVVELHRATGRGKQRKWLVAFDWVTVILFPNRPISWREIDGSSCCDQVALLYDPSPHQTET